MSLDWNKACFRNTVDSERRRFSRTRAVFRWLMSPRVPAFSRPVRLLVPLAATVMAAAIQRGVLTQTAIAPFVFFFVGVALASWLGGRVAGLLAVLLSAATANYLFIPPLGAWSTGRQALTATALFVVAGGFVAFLCASFRRATLDLQRTLDERERTAARLAQSERTIDAERMRWRGMVEAIPDEVWVSDAAGNATLLNPVDGTAPGLLEGRGRSRPMEELLREVDVRDPDGSARTMEQAPLLRALKGEIVDGEEILRDLETGEERHRHVSAAPMRDAAGTITGALAIARDITEEKRTEKALRESEEALREADRRKDEFLNVLSHELRNPLAPIQSAVYILARPETTRDQARRARNVIERQTEHLAALVDELLDVTRIARGKIELRRETLDLRQVVRRTGEDHRALLERRGIALSIDVSEEESWVEADPVRLSQMLANLLQNAAKFTPKGGSVRLETRCSGGRAEVHVTDTGVGIEDHLLKRIFEPFVQATQDMARTEGGLGLGLALVKGLAQLHGGSVEARSDGPGFGAELVVTLPRADAPLPRIEERRQEGSKPAARRVLVVDDNRDAAESLAELVELFGHRAEVAFDGPEAIEKARATRPDVVLCDIGLPGMSGYDVARVLNDERAPGMQLVAVSGYAQPQDVRMALESGFDRHLAKPPKPEEIERILAGERRRLATA